MSEYISTERENDGIEYQLKSDLYVCFGKAKRAKILYKYGFSIECSWFFFLENEIDLFKFWFNLVLSPMYFYVRFGLHG